MGKESKVFLFGRNREVFFRDGLNLKIGIRLQQITATYNINLFLCRERFS